MARVAFKTAIYRTNPHVMRCFVIDDTRTIEELIQTALISHGIVSDQSVKMFRNTATIGHSVKIHDMFNENSKKDRWRICVPIKTNVNQSVYNINRQEEWIINISMVDLEDSDMESYAEPALVLARGIQKHRSINDIYTFNMMHSSIIARNFYYGNSNIVYAEEVMPSIDKINKQIEKKLSKNGKEAEVFIANMNRTMPMNKIFEKFRVDDLKLTIQIQRYPIPYVKSKKADIVRALVNYYSREKGFWKKVIEEMPIEEYMAFKNYVSDDGDSDDIKSADCRTLNKYMLCFLDGYDNCISKELVEYYADYMSENGDEALILEKKAYKVLDVCLELYGIFTREVYERMCEILYEDEESLKKLWQGWHRNDEWCGIGSDFTCTRRCLPMVNRYIKSNEHKIADNYYYPTKEEAEGIYEYGLGFSDEAYDILTGILESFLRNSYQMLMITDVLIDRIYYILHYDGDFEDIKKEIRNSYYYFRSNAGSYKPIKDACEEVSPEVRLVSRMGYTKEGK